MSLRDKIPAKGENRRIIFHITLPPAVAAWIEEIAKDKDRKSAGVIARIVELAWQQEQNENQSK